MKAMFTVRRLACVTLGLLAMTASVHAQPLFAPRPFSGDIRFSVEGVQTILSKGPRPFTINVKRPLDDISVRLVESLNRDLPKAGLNFRGFRPYNVSVVRGASSSMKALVVQNDIQVEYFLPGNTVTSSFTTPDIVDVDIPLAGRVNIGLDRAADPRMSLTFDLTLRATISPQLKGAPRVKTVSASVSNARLRPVNLPAKVLSAGNDFVSFVGGPNFRGMAERAINAQGIRVNDPLSMQMQALSLQLAGHTREARGLNVFLDGNRVSVMYLKKAPALLIVR